jgi:orotate phosphoribosyltransferase
VNYRSFSDLDACIGRNLWKLPADTDVVVGVPRSGLLAANLIALQLNLPLADLDGFLQGRLLSTGPRLGQEPDVARFRTVVIVDDSVSSGQEMRRVRARVQAAQVRGRVVYVAVYAIESSVTEIDIHFEICPHPRTFAWNLMHRPSLGFACVDIDGVLCVDPTEEENDDGARYARFLETAHPLLRPSYEIGTLVTCRLEKYRPQTAAWLTEHRVRYRELVMWDLPDKQARLASAGHGAFKAAVYEARPEAELFIESSASQAQVIADLTLKPVICIETQSVPMPGTRAVLKRTVTNSPRWTRKALQKVWSSLRGYMLRLGRAS